jgi:maleate cis-trans isomerase
MRRIRSSSADPRQRVGVIVPSSNTVVEPELAGLLPPALTMHVARVGMGGDLVAAIGAMADDLLPEVRKLAQVEPSALAFACTSASFYDGEGSDVALCEQIAEAAGAPATTATTAGVWALRELGVERVVFCSPYAADVHRRGVERFEAAGFDVVAGDHLGLSKNAEICTTAPEEVAALVRRSWVADADAVFVSCTGLPTADVLAPLSEELGRPVISSNAALARHVAALTARVREATPA